VAVGAPSGLGGVAGMPGTMLKAEICLKQAQNTVLYVNEKTNAKLTPLVAFLVVEG
jgi:hypothetical protein